MISYLEGLLTVADIFISLFIISYALFFLKKTYHSNHRRPWELLIFAVIIFFFAEIFTLLSDFDLLQVYGLINVLKTIFIGIILFVFSLNYDLVVKDKELTIHKKKS